MMKIKHILLCCFACSMCIPAASMADCPHCRNSGSCYQEVIKYRCVEVPDVKPVKKVFYECKCIPFCVPSLPPFLHCDCESGCECPRFKRVLVKREVEVGEICGTKCVVQSYVERVPVPCCHCECGNRAAQESTAPSPTAALPTAPSPTAGLPTAASPVISARRTPSAPHYEH